MNVFNRLIGRLKDLKLSVKLGLFLAVLAVGITLIGFAYNAAVEIGADSLQKERELGKFSAEVEKIRIAVLESQQFEKIFQVNRKLEALEKFDAKISEAEGYVNKLTPFLQTKQDKQIVEQVRKNLKVYQASFYEAVETQVELGLDTNSGLLGDLKGSFSDFQEALKPLLNIELEQTRSELQNTEKNFFQTGNKVFIQKMDDQRNTFLEELKGSSSSKNTKTTLTALLDDYLSYFQDAVDAFQRSETKFMEVEHAVDNITPLITKLLDVRAQYGVKLETNLEATQTTLTQQFLIAIFGIPFALVVILVILGRSILKPVSLVQNAVNRVTEGDITARTGLRSNDEIGSLGQAFDKLLDERVAKMLESEKETEALNSSIISLLEGVSKLSQRDLTIKVPVAEDVTGTLSDALNLLTTETAKVLHDVHTISDRVNVISTEVKSQSDVVKETAEVENQEINLALKEQTEALNAMLATSQLAIATNKASVQAIASTETALGSVTQTIDGINQIRETIGEAEKRIKRLGERSQEITGMVNLINGIAERTHILALNASMHAASAGEAGRGFMIIADEVQTLAESSRDATSQISTLVNNIQVDTADTVNSMNTVISQVVEGTRLAEEAGDRMKETQDKTNMLATSVQKIAKYSENQVNISKRLRERAVKIQKSTQHTTEQLNEQTTFTDRLVQDADELINAVSKFKLPAQAKG